CDELKVDGSTRASGDARNSYSHAMKMRASLSYGYGQSNSRGRQPWRLSDSGRWIGNPSMSDRVSRYMVSLRRRKARSGQVAMSARAITPDILRRLYEFNSSPSN
ncbi:hypothetical protein C8T65DRAFT_541761, partial [Cerioporus squamosus]